MFYYTFYFTCDCSLSPVSISRNVAKAKALISLTICTALFTSRVDFVRPERRQTESDYSDKPQEKRFIVNS